MTLTAHRITALRRRLWRVAALAAAATAGFAQTDLSSQEIIRAREEKQSQLAPDEAPEGERRFVAIKNSRTLRTFFGNSDGVRLGFGNLVPGAGFSIGPDWSRGELLDGRLWLSASGRASTRQYYFGEFRASLPELFAGYGFLDFRTTHRNYGQMPYFGPGPRTRKGERTNYRLEDTEVELRPGLRPFRRVQVGAIGSFLGVNVGPGTTDRFPSTEAIFPPSLTPGIDRQGSFWRTGVFAIYDGRRGGTEPTGGMRYAAEYTRLSDRSFGVYSHGRFDADIQHYIPFFNERRIIALHAHTTLTDARRGQTVPFYLQPVVGGAETLRGFRPFRFYDNNAFWMNGEYRWETSLGLDMAIFADGGKVFPEWGQLNFSRLEGSFGIGFRAKMRRDLVMRVDIGASREGVQAWFRFNNVF
jgi:hypothetical protein